MSDDEYWPFENDADRNDPLTEHRIAATSSHPRWAYLVAFDQESEERPTDAEMVMLASYLDEYKDRWYGQSGYRNQMERRALDVDGGANGVVFHKWAADDWGFRRRSFERGYLFTVVPPAMRDRYSDGWAGPLSLAELMDRIHTIVDTMSVHWAEWKAAHPDVFAGAVR